MVSGQNTGSVSFTLLTVKPKKVRYEDSVIRTPFFIYILTIKGDLRIKKERITHELIKLGSIYQKVTNRTIRQTVRLTLESEKVTLNYL